MKLKWPPPCLIPEAVGARNGIGLAKRMGQDSSFIAAYAALANSVVNFCLVSEVALTLDAFQESLKVRLKNRRHAVIVLAEGAGQNIFSDLGQADVSGNSCLEDIWLFLNESTNAYFKNLGLKVRNSGELAPSIVLCG